MQDFRELKVWQRAHELTLRVYGVTGRFPAHELYGLTSQMRRCAASIPANIAEGRCRRGDREFGRFAQIAMGSAGELEYFVILAGDLTYITPKDREELERTVGEVKRMLAGLLECLAIADPAETDVRR